MQRSFIFLNTTLFKTSIRVIQIKCVRASLRLLAVSIVSGAVCVAISCVNDKVCTEEVGSACISVMVVVVKQV